MFGCVRSAPVLFYAIRSATRSLALRLRGFRAISASCGVIGFLVSGFQPLVALKRFLHRAIFQRMKADDRQPAAGFKLSGNRRKAISSDFNSSFTAIRKA